ncbi:MAG TPA: hypothetical protein DC058_19320, partial [Planctomycetaceae bacterium]|nr:hypothetical protein [Planctomycetaceae bacterium]
GDWIENCTAVIEHRCGALELVHIDSPQNSVQRPPRIAMKIPAEFSDQHLDSFTSGPRMNCEFSRPA